MIYPLMFTSQNLSRPVRIGLLTIAFACISCLSCAWSTPSQTTGTVAKPNIQILAPSELASDDDLQVPVSFTAKSLSLGEVLALLQQKSNLNITISPDAPALDFRLTASIQEMPLCQVFMGLSRLYGVRWAKTGVQTYILLPSDKNALEIGLMQLGDFSAYENRILAFQRQSPDHLDWPQEVTKYINAKELRFGATPKISTLPPELVSKIRHDKEQLASLRLLEVYQAAMESSIDDDVLHAEGPKPSSAPLQGNAHVPAPQPRIFVQTKDGHLVAPLNVMPSVVSLNDKATKPRPNPKNVPMPRERSGK